MEVQVCTIAISYSLLNFMLSESCILFRHWHLH